MENIIIFGAGGHAKVIIDIVEKQGLYNISGILVDTPEVHELMGYSVLGKITDCHHYKKGIIAIGDNFGRRAVSEKITSINPEFEFITAIHPSAVIGKEVWIGDGSVIVPGAIINAHAIVGEHCIINTQASVGHDVVIGNYSTVAPSASIGGNSTIGNLSTISMGSNVIQKITIGNGTLVGAGSTVIRDLPDEVLSFGSPAKIIRYREPNEKYV